MAYLIIKDLQGNEQPLQVQNLHITKQLNTLTQIEFNTVNTKDNSTAFNMIQPRSIFIDPVDNEVYRISQKSGQEIGDYFQLQITALQALTDLSDKYISDTLYNTQSLASVMNLITKGTNFKYKLHGTFQNHDFGSKDTSGSSPFGAGLAYDLFINSVVKDYNCEWTCHGYQIDLYNKVGADNKFVCLDKDDVYSIQETSDFTTLKTQISGTGKVDDNGNPTVTATYTSPNAKQFGVIEATPYSDDRVTNKDTLINELKAQLQDYPLVQYQANVNKFKKYAQSLSNDYEIGNYGLIRTRWGIDETVRISKIDIYRDTPGSADVLTFGNLQLDPAEVISRLSQAQTDFKNEINQIKNNHQSSSSDTNGETISIETPFVGTINVSSVGTIIYVDFDLDSLSTQTTVCQFGNSFKPSAIRNGNLISNTNPSYIISWRIDTNGNFIVMNITDLAGNPVQNITQSVSGNFSYTI